MLSEVCAVVHGFGDGVDAAPLVDVLLLVFGVHDVAACLEHDGRGLGDLLRLADEVDERVRCRFLRDEHLLFAGFHCFLL